MRAHYIVYVLRPDPRRREPRQERIELFHVPEQPLRTGLVVADAGIDENRMPARAHEKRLNRQHEVSRYRIQRARLHPRPMSRPVVGRGLGKEAQRVESCADGLDDTLDDDLAKGVLRHGRFSMGEFTRTTGHRT